MVTKLDVPLDKQLVGGAPLRARYGIRRRLGMRMTKLRGTHELRIHEKDQWVSIHRRYGHDVLWWDLRNDLV
jgi:hypothetical protein